MTFFPTVRSACSRDSPPWLSSSHTAEWSRVEHYAPPDWKHDASPTIYSWRGTGVGVERSWDAPNRRNHEVLVCTAEVRTERAVTGLVSLDQPAAPTEWDGRYFADEHANGTRSV